MKSPKKNFNPTWIYLFILAGILIASLATGDGNSPMSMTAFTQSDDADELVYSKFQQLVRDGNVESIIVYSDNDIKVTVKKNAQASVFGKNANQHSDGSFTITGPDYGKVEDFLSEAGYTGKVEYKSARNYFTLFLLNVLPFVIFIGFLFYMNRGLRGGGGGIFGIGRSQAKLFDKDKSDHKVTFKDVAGLEGAKQEVEEIVSFLKNPQKYTELGGKIPKGALLVGPPGTGKTLLAKAVAGEADVPFFSMAGSDFVEMFVGVGASRVRDLFRQAKEKSPCIIFIDEIDAVGRARGKNAIGGNDERESTLNQLLTEMDGFGTNSGIIILAATNRAEILDKALLRAGRFDRQIHVELPDVTERHQIFDVHLKPLKLDPSVDVEFLSKQTPGFSGADIANVCNEAALIAARNGKKAVDADDFMAAVDRIIGGLERKNKIMTDEEKRSIAFHEAGHATISWMLRYANPLVKVTIVPRGEALGAAWYLPEERQLTNREHMLDEICATLGGRAAEELFLHQTSTGALNDLERVTKRVYAMVAYYGMSERLPNICYYDSTGQEYQFSKPYSEQTAKTIDEEVARIIAEQMARAKDLLQKYEDGHHGVAQALYDREVITSEDVQRILGPRPWKSRQDELIQANRERQEAENEKKAMQMLAEREAEQLPTQETPEQPQGTPEQPSEEQA